MYVPALPSLLEFHFVPKIIRDLDIVDHNLFEDLLSVFLTTNKVPQGDISIVIGENASFIKDFSGTDQATLQKQAKEFIQHVPFDVVAGTTFMLSNGLRAYATNKDLYDSMIKMAKK